MAGHLASKLVLAASSLTVEPLVFLVVLIKAFSGIASNDLYLQKACQVNLNYTEAVCANLTLPEHNETQDTVQQYVSSVQAYNGFLQNLPPILFVLLGPLSDAYGRKPLMVLSLGGYFILNSIFLVNSIFFMELKVEYLLFECLQDLTGGYAIFTLAVNSYMVDVSSEAARTARICFVSAAGALGFMVGNPLGAAIRAALGYTAVFGINLALATATLTYTIAFLKESSELVGEEKREEMKRVKENAELRCDKGIFRKVVLMILSSWVTLARQRPQRRHLYAFLLTIMVAAFAGTEEGPVVFMFYKRQYKIDSETFAWLGSAWGLCAFFSQLLLVPFLSLTLGLRDTTILILAFASNILSYIVEVSMTQVEALFFSWTALQILWCNMEATAMSAASKLTEPGEIGRVLVVVQLAKAAIVPAGMPFYAMMYKVGLELSFPALCRCISMACFGLGLALSSYNHWAMDRRVHNVQDKTTKDSET